MRTNDDGAQSPTSPTSRTSPTSLTAPPRRPAGGYEALEPREPHEPPEPLSQYSPPRRDPEVVGHAREALAALYGPPGARSFAVRYWDGTVDEAGAVEGVGRPAPFTLVVRRPGALRRAFLPPSEIALVEAYLRDDMDVEGDLTAASVLADAAAGALRGGGAARLARLTRLTRALLALPRDDAPAHGAADGDPGAGRRARLASVGVVRHTRRRDRRAVRFHYDVGNDFYALWLDERMQYSCAYFPTGAEDIDAAQRAKLEYICRKLRLRPGERLLDVGCGWGGLLEYAASRYGVEGVGVTLSERQAEGARARLARAGLAERCRVELRDYRDLEGEGRFDKVVSVGMREHVGAARLPDYFAAAHRLLRPGGLFLDHGIVRGGAAAARYNTLLARAKRRVWGADAFIQRYVFPDGELVPLASLIRDAERTGLEARDVENLREHYALTLRHWVRRLEARHAEAAALVGERTYRVWRLYMAGTVLNFQRGGITLCQTLYAKPEAGGRVEVPMTRADLYVS